jgi:tetrapyrrole methylase family protein/MazG family protein
MPPPDLDAVVQLVARLRAPDGCPWDQAQTHRTLTGLLIEEAYEVVEAIEANDSQALREELGDLLLHVAFHVQIAQEAGEFRLDDVLTAVEEKLVRRHPHVFGDHPTQDIGQIKARWEELKHEEKSHDQRKAHSALPALIEARKALDRAANLGVLQEILGEDELHEGKEPLDVGDAKRLGQMLLGMVARARESGLEPEFCLKRVTARLTERLEAKLTDDTEEDVAH